MRMIRLLALLPFAAMLIGPFFVNRVEPTILGMPFLLAWCVAWIGSIYTARNAHECMRPHVEAEHSP
jgi:hypothetical protein